MPQTNFKGSTEPHVLPVGFPGAEPISLEVHPGATGRVEIQLWDPATSAWFTPAAADFTKSTKGIDRVTRSNSPELRIVAFGDALFRVTGQ